MSDIDFAPGALGYHTNTLRAHTHGVDMSFREIALTS